MRGRIVKIGNSQGIRIPKPLLEQTGIADDVELEVKDNQIIIHPLSSPRQGWDAAFKEMAEKEDDLVVNVDVTNTGDRAGEEVVQLYVGYENSAIDRPVKSLVGFSKVLMKKGETKTVSISVPVSELAYYNVKKSAWKIEKMNIILAFS